MSIKISACTIAKNEEKNIARSIESYKDYVDEIIIVDTGSTDDTVKIAESLGAKVIHFEWINDFAAAKNCAINAAKGDWILFLDADEWIKDDGGKNLNKVVENAIAKGFNSISLRMLNLDDDGSLTETTSSLRIFANKPNIRYVRKIHEHLLDANTGKALPSMRADELVLNHSGYAESISKTKIKRNKELLEKNYMEGFSEAIDYFYLARENVYEKPYLAEKFLNRLVNDEEKMEAIKKLDIANNIHDLKIKLIKILENKYSFSEKIAVIEDAMKNFPDDPAYYYFKYVILTKSGDFENLDLLYKALELDKTYESKVGSNTNAFSRYKADALYEVGQEALIEHDNLKAMNYFVQAIQAGQLKEEILKGLLYIIEAQNINEKLAFLNSIFDINKEETLKFIIQTLRLTNNSDIFLYYFVKHYKNFGEVDVSLFTSMLLNKKFEDAASKYLTILLSENDERAENLVVAAIIAGELKTFYEENKICFSPISRKILNSYFEELPLDKVTKEEEEFIVKVIPEIIYIASKENLEKIKKTFNYNENVLRSIIKIYHENRNYKVLIEEINTFIENDISDEFAGEVTAKLGECFYMLGDFASAKLYLEQTIEIGFLDKNVMKIFEKLLKKVDIEDSIKEKFETYKYLLTKFIEAKNNMLSEKIKDIDSSKIVKNVEEFSDMISNTINLTESFKMVLFDYAIKLHSMKKFCLAEKYYTILLKCNYNLGKCYYALGNIYNQLKLVKLSYYCYHKAFKSSIDFAESILKDDHKNKNYLYNPVEGKIVETCPICGKIGELASCYQYIEDNNLIEDAMLIVNYRLCKECGHIYAENYAQTEFYLEKLDDKSKYMFNANDIKEKLELDSKIIIVDETDVLSKVFAEDFDIVYLHDSFEKKINLSNLLEILNDYKDRTLVTVINNANSVINEDLDMPIWAKVGITNVYSKSSITKLLKQNGYQNIKIYDSKFVEGKMVVIAKM